MSQLGDNSHRDGKSRAAVGTLPRLLDVHLAAEYCSVGAQTIRDWVVDGILRPVEMPGSTLRDNHGNIVTPACRRKIGKILIAIEDLDTLIDQRKAGA